MSPFSLSRHSLSGRASVYIAELDHSSLEGEQVLKYSVFGRLIDTEPQEIPAGKTYFAEGAKILFSFEVICIY